MEQKTLFDPIENVLFEENLGNEILKMVETANGIQISHYILDVKTNDATLTRSFYAVQESCRYGWRDNARKICRAYQEGWRTRQQLVGRIGGIVL